MGKETGLNYAHCTYKTMIYIEKHKLRQHNTITVRLYVILCNKHIKMCLFGYSMCILCTSNV